jgi:hypothetical protein
MKQHMPNISIRFDEPDLKMARKLGIDLPELARQALKNELTRMKVKCPTCGQEIRGRNEILNVSRVVSCN